jgi:hypothetical protein
MQIVWFEVADPGELPPLSSAGQAAARDLMFDLMSQALIIFRNCIKSGAHDRLVAEHGAGMTFLTLGVHRLPDLMKAASVSGGHQTIAEEMFGHSAAGSSPAAREVAARDYLFDSLYWWFLEFRGTRDRALWTLANAMHNQPGLMKTAARSDGEYQTIIIEFFRWVPPDYRIWAVHTLMRQRCPDQVLVDRLRTFDGGEDSWRRLMETIHHPDGRREQRPRISDPTIEWLCHYYEADRTS